MNKTDLKILIKNISEKSAVTELTTSSDHAKQMLCTFTGCCLFFSV